ncbi:hypothetical protein [Paraburkholderia adhaesiva]|uniref:hypothetical protein n=1 Tax=Paraburkholderia adhaesiva TaxID=2883244 RepID=UPI001F1E3D71|nr:hypothetical protein [Paraburkholderia adhaesiva]
MMVLNGHSTGGLVVTIWCVGLSGSLLCLFECRLKMTAVVDSRYRPYIFRGEDDRIIRVIFARVIGHHARDHGRMNTFID